MRRKPIIWTDDIIAFIKENYEKMSNAAMAKELKMNFSTFSGKLHSMGLFRMEMEYWTDEQIAFLKKHYKKIGDKELAKIYNEKWPKKKWWTIKHIEKKRNYLNLKRTVAELKKIKQRNKKNGSWLNTTTWETRGTAPIGEVRIWNGGWKTANGYTTSKFKVIKLEEGFVHYAHWLYEQHFGPMPAGHCVGFKDRDNMNVVPENLEAITRAEHAMRNRNKYPAVIREIDSLIHQLKHKVYEHEKKTSNRRSA